MWQQCIDGVASERTSSRIGRFTQVLQCQSIVEDIHVRDIDCGLGFSTASRVCSTRCEQCRGSEEELHVAARNAVN